jgi:hypothetical protein
MHLIKYNLWQTFNLLHVSKLACHPQGFFLFTRIQAQHAKPACVTLTAMIKILKNKKHKFGEHKITMLQFYGYRLTPCNITEDPRPELHSDRSLQARKCNYRIFIVYFFKPPSAALLFFQKLYFNHFQIIVSKSIAIYRKATFRKYIPRF